MSGFPGPEGYSETLARQLREERERERGEAMHVPPERSPDADDLLDAIRLRLVLLENMKADRMTDRDLDKIRRLLQRAHDEIVQLWNPNRKEGTSEAK